MRIFLQTIPIALAALALGAAPAPAWEYQELLNGEGDRGRGIIQPAANQRGIALGFGCEGDRWRRVALLPGGKDPFPLSASGGIRFGFKADELGAPATWKVSKREGLPPRYFAPAPTQLMSRLYDEEVRDSKAVFYVQVRPAKKGPVLLEFPLAGLRESLAEHLWKPCKLDVYFGDPD